jgi:16S rRNA (cytidine1402-2'-O)-methyltransferase
LIYYESPYRIQEFLKAALQIFGDRQASFANDMTKLFERVERGPLSYLLTFFETNEPKGEYTVVIAGMDRQDEEAKKTGRGN